MIFIIIYSIASGFSPMFMVLQKKQALAKMYVYLAEAFLIYFNFINGLKPIPIDIS